MTTHIKNAEYRRFWEALMLKHYECVISGKMPGKASEISTSLIEAMCTDWASRFADPDTLADIEANEMKRGRG